MLKFSSILIPSKYGVWHHSVQHGKFGQKMAVAKYPAFHGNVSHIETFNGVFWFKTSRWSWPCFFIWDIRWIAVCMILMWTGTFISYNAWNFLNSTNFCRNFRKKVSDFPKNVFQYMRGIINILIVDVSLFIQSSCKSMKKLTPKSQYFGIFYHLAKCQK